MYFYRNSLIPQLRSMLNDPVMRASLLSSFGVGMKDSTAFPREGKKASSRKSISRALRKSTFVSPADQRDITRGTGEFELLSEVSTLAFFRMVVAWKGDFLFPNSL